jgi:hypothetical protein
MYVPALISIGEASKESLANAAFDQRRYLLHYVLTYGEHGSLTVAAGLSLALLLVMLVGIGELEFLRQLFFFSLELPKHTDDLAYIKLAARIYLGMHSLTDVVAGIGFGIVILAFWLAVHDHVDAFVVSGQNGTSINPLACCKFWRHS